jgi:hypothetical protein
MSAGDNGNHLPSALHERISARESELLAFSRNF